MDSLDAVAFANLEALAGNPYPGRGIVVGFDETGQNIVQVYWIMGRSENSRNRFFGHDGQGRVYTEPIDPSRMQNLSLVIYNAMREAGNFFVVSNGSQTDHVCTAVAETGSFSDAMAAWEYEPDKPNYTPRITAVAALPSEEVPLLQMAVLRKSRWGTGCDRNFFEYAGLGKGVGYCITTYAGDGEPLPAFAGEPYLLPLKGDMTAIGQEFWNTLNGANKVSLAVKFISIASGRSRVFIVNRGNRAKEAR